jgi:nicotinate-nucleotide pyrophosphorylase
MNITDVLEIHKVNLNDLLERWKKNICKKRSCHHQIEIQQNREEDESVKNQVDIIPLDEIKSNSIDKNYCIYNYRISCDRILLKAGDVYIHLVSDQFVDTNLLVIQAIDLDQYRLLSRENKL